MIEVSAEQFEKIVTEAIDAIPEVYFKHLDNVAFLVEDEPSPEQRQKLSLHPNQSLFGLYEGIPLPLRGGRPSSLPDKITIFRLPTLAASHDFADVVKRVKNTVWHEVAHYYGLDHDRIHELENN